MTQPRGSNVRILLAAPLVLLALMIGTSEGQVKKTKIGVAKSEDGKKIEITATEQFLKWAKVEDFKVQSSGLTFNVTLKEKGKSPYLRYTVYGEKGEVLENFKAWPLKDDL